MKVNAIPLKKYIAISAILIVLIMTVLDVTVVNVAIPVLAVEFGISDSLSVWIVTIYELIITMLILPLSSLGDMYSYRRTFLTGVVIFTLSSALCAASQNFSMILIARALQGIGAACVMSVNIALTRLIYPKEILGRGLALNGMVIASATAAGPTIAGALLSIASWHWLFLINIPLGIVAWIVGRKHLPQNTVSKSTKSYDWIGAFENAAMFGLLFLALGSYKAKDDELRLILMLAICIIIGYFYVRREMHRSEPMLPVDLFRIRLYSLSIATSVCSFIAQMLAMVSMPFILMNSYGFSSITTGLLMTPWPVATMICSPLAARFVERHNAGKTAAVGMAVFAIGLLLLIFIPLTEVTGLNIAWRMAICGIGYGIFQTPNNIVMVSSTPIHRSGGAGGMQSTARLVGQTLGATLVTIIFVITSGTTYTMVHHCLSIAIVFALIAGIFSLSRS
ncbi:MFS transporter [uncultured Duncaniella sp.]|uniref:MFS transporter n=1 Tax=uncultured Duncaniella sp. TaxID=2768039 RepID=UPI0026580A9E|nr:MFS transporter [uncultured Duncaniella sp.]